MPAEILYGVESEANQISVWNNHWRRHQSLLLTLLDQAITSGGNLLASVLVARAAGAAGLASYVLLIRVLDVVLETQNVFIISPYLFRRRLYDDRTRPAFAGSAIAHQVVLTFIVLFAILLSGWAFKMPTAFCPIYAIALFVTSMSCREFARRFYFAEMEVTRALVLDAIVVVIQTCILLILINNHRFSLGWALNAMSFGCLLGILHWLLMGLRRTAIVPRRIMADLLQNIRFGRWLFAGNMTLLASTQVPTWSLLLLRGPLQLGAFAASDVLTNIMRTFLTGCQNFIGPECARLCAEGDYGSLRRFNKNTTLLLFVLMSACFVTMSLWGDGLVRTVFGRQFSHPGSMPLLLSLNLLISSLTLTTTYTLSALNRPDLNLRANLIGVTLQLFGGSWLIFYYGGTGAALGLLLFTIGASTGRWFSFVRQVPRNGPDR